MAQVTDLSVTALPGPVFSFSPKEEAVAVTDTPGIRIFPVEGESRVFPVEGEDRVFPIEGH